MDDADIIDPCIHCKTCVHPDQEAIECGGCGLILATSTGITSKH